MSAIGTAMMAPAWADRSAREALGTVSDLALYVHWPFCASKCPYCDFNSHVRERIDQERWRRALLRELEHTAALTGRRRLTSIFFGGGTPSLMAPETVAAVVEAAGRHWTALPDLEVTLEANPGSVEAGRFAGYRDAGINRLSLGVQSFDDAELSFLGRRHDAEEARAAIALAAECFERWSFDLITALPGQDPTRWRERLDEALAFEPGHLSVYQLTIETGTVFEGQARRGELVLPEDDLSLAFFEVTQERLAAAGLPAYEISNHARRGAACRHNLTTWRGGDYAGIGPGAHGRLTLSGQRTATRQHRAPEAWLAAVEAEGHATRARQPLNESERLVEAVLLGLRLTEGIGREVFHEGFGAEPEALLPAEALAALVEAGYLALDAAGLRVTAEGRVRLNAVTGHLLAAVGEDER